MNPDDLTIEIRSLALGSLGQVGYDYILDAKFIKRFNNVGNWTMELPADYDIAIELANPGRGIKVTGLDNKVLFSGPVDNFVKVESTSDPEGEWHFTGVDDMIHLSDALCFPDPLHAVNAQTAAYHTRTENAESAMIAYVRYNIGNLALADRRITGVVTQTNQNRGLVIKAGPRFDRLGLVLSDIASQGGGLGFDLVQKDLTKEFQVYVPRDLTKTIRMDIENDQLEKTEYGFGSPNGTRYIVAGQGEGVERRIIQTTSAASLESESDWGRKIEQFKDRRDTALDADLIAEGLEGVTLNGVTVQSLSVTPSDDLTMIYAKDWFLGDKVAVIVDEVELGAVVTEAIISIDQDGIHTAATLGDPVGFDFESKLISKQQDQEKRIAYLEKNIDKPTFDVDETMWDANSTDHTSLQNNINSLQDTITALTTKVVGDFSYSGSYSASGGAKLEKLARVVQVQLNATKSSDVVTGEEVVTLPSGFRPPGAIVKFPIALAGSSGQYLGSGVGILLTTGEINIQVGSAVPAGAIRVHGSFSFIVNS